jgi:hypothetical protein
LFRYEHPRDSGQPGEHIRGATGRVVSVLGSVSPVHPLFAGEYLAVDRTGDYVLVWTAANATNGLALHGWVHGGSYHRLAPAFPPSYPAACTR